MTGGERTRIRVWIALGAAALVTILAMKPAANGRKDTTAGGAGSAAAPAGAGARTVASSSPSPSRPVTDDEWRALERLLPLDPIVGAEPDRGSDGSTSRESPPIDGFRPYPGPTREVAEPAP